MDEVRQYKLLLKKYGYYITKARLRLFMILQNHPALTIQELIKLSAKNDQATVYRNIIVLERLGVISRLQLGWRSKLELSDMFRHHHHHVTCIRCGQVTGLQDSTALEKEIAKLTQTLKFKQTDHQLEIRGICRSCKTRPPHTDN